MRCIQGRSWIVAITLCLIAIVAAGCAGDEGSLNGFVEGPTSAPSPTPFGPATDPVTNNDEEVLQILSISPTSGPAGTQVTIVAEGFDPEKDTIFIGEREFSSDAAPIAIVIPEDLAPGTYAVALHRDDIESNKVNFEVTEAAPEDPSEDDDADADADADVEEEGNPELVGVRCFAGGGAFIRSESGYAEYRYQPLYKPCLFAKPRRQPTCVGRICPRTPPQCARDGCPDPRVRDHLETDPRETDTRDEALREDDRTNPERERANGERRRPPRGRPPTHRR